jgi:23S rRNA U2552 (ribose-2'-O)-methylase RlmE/FtsJ
MTKNKEDKVTEDAVKDINCFIIMPISNQLGYEPGHFRLVYEDIIKPAVIAAGMKPIRADETKNTNLIQLDILRKVIESDIAICDMSSKNPNVFYELGVRQAFDKPTVLMIDEATTAPFDVSSLRYVDYKKGMGFRDVKQAVEDLTRTLIDTYAKREDKSEINSLIRLMDLTTPAQLNQVDISAEDRTALQIAELTSSMHNMQVVQNKIFESLDQINANRFEADHADILFNEYLKENRNNSKGLVFKEPGSSRFTIRKKED